VVEGESDGPGSLHASSVIIKHEDEFLTGETSMPAIKR
jgi:cytochrome c-type biogenesis protein CcmE